MIEAQYLNTDRTAGEAIAYSPWMPRGGDNVIVNLDLVQVVGPGQLQVDVFHKNEDETGNGASAGTISYTGTIGRTELEVTGLKELVRYRFSCKVTETGDGFVLYRMLGPVWFDAVKV